MSNTRSIKEAPSAKNKNVFDLDVLERDGAPRPFVAKLGGKEYTFADPFEMDWQVSEGIDQTDMVGSLKALLGDQYEDFCKHNLSVWKLQKLSDAVGKHYAKYYGSQGEDSASSGI